MAAPECHHRFNDLPTIYVQVAEGIADQTGSRIPLAKWDPSGSQWDPAIPLKWDPIFPLGCTPLTLHQKLVPTCRPYC